MKKHSWLNALENMSLVGLGAGSVASILLNQVFFTTAPLSLLVVLGLLNRRKLAQITDRRETTLAETDQYLALQVDRLHNQVSTLPTPETLNRLNRTLLLKNQEVSERLQSEISSLKQGMHQRLASVEQQGGAVRKELRQVMGRCAQLTENLQQLTTDLGDLSGQVQAETLTATVTQIRQELSQLQANLEGLGQAKPNLTVLQEHMTRLDRQFSKLPPPVDVSSLKHEIAELIKIVAELVPRRDLAGVSNELRNLQEQQESLRQSVVAIETAALNFRRHFNELPRSEAQFSQTNGPLDAIEAELAKQPLELVGSTTIYPELQELAASYLGNLRQQLSAIQDFASQLAQQQQQLKEQFSQLPQTLDMVALQRQFTELSQRIPASEGEVIAFKARIQEVMQQELDYINQQMQVITALPQSGLIFDLPIAAGAAGAAEESGPELAAGSRIALEQALTLSERRLIVIWPWSDQSDLDEALFDKFAGFLEQGKRLDIGWCHLSDRREARWLSKLHRGWISQPQPNSLIQATLHQFLQLKRRYPNRFQFKILGSAENFLVCDRSFAVLGIADALKTATPFPELQLKLKTSDAAVIQRLVQRFDDPTLSADDLAAYWNRAVTRYDLNDRAGAIADYNHILAVNPTDPAALNARGLAHYELGDLERAVGDLSEAIRHAPEPSVAYCNRAFIRAEQGQVWEAIQDYSAAISAAIQAGPQALAYFHRGIVYQQLEHPAEAIADYGEAIRLAPDSPVARYHRGLAYQKLDRAPEAVADFERAAQLFWQQGSKANAQKALQNLAKLQTIAEPEPLPKPQREALSAVPTRPEAMPEAMPEAV